VSSEIRWALGHEKKVFHALVFDFRQILGMLVEGWNTDDTKFRLTALATRFVRERMQVAETEAERRWLAGCRRNTSTMIYNIMKLEEANVSADQLDQTDRNVKLFCEVWNYVEKKDPAIGKFRAEMARLSDGLYLRNKLAGIFGKKDVSRIFTARLLLFFSDSATHVESF